MSATIIHMSPQSFHETAVWLQQFPEDSALRIVESLNANGVARSDCDRLVNFVNSKRFGTLS